MKYQAPKGTRDFLPRDMMVRNRVMETLVSQYRLYGFQQWDGPAFENTETLTRKSGDQIIQQIYTFVDKAGRNLGLRFELTASLARIIANNPALKKPLKVFNIGKVWRYERPQAGRFREFLQADADIFGSDSMTAEVELLLLASSILREFDFNEYVILLNNRKILEAQLRLVSIPVRKQEAALRSLDKFTKIGKEGVRKEMVQADINAAQCNQLLEIVSVKGTNEEQLQNTRELLKDDAEGLKGVSELDEILTFLNAMDFRGTIEISPSLVRGLDYYTGPIFEIQPKNAGTVSSFAGGGRYDKLVELFGGKPTPAAGISFGIERLIEIIMRKEQNVKPFPPVRVYVTFSSPELWSAALRAAELFRNAGISAEYDLTGKSLRKQLAYADSNQIPYSFIILSRDEQKLKDMNSGQEIDATVDDAIKRLKKGA